jgi:transcriptional regulator with XRE-family HTH domain
MKVRRAQGWTQSRLAERLDALGYSISQATLAKIETGRRQVTIQDLVAIAVALDTPPLLLLLPHDLNAEVALTPRVTARALDVRRWFASRKPIRETDTPDDFTTTLEFDRYLRRDPHLFALIGVVEDEALGALGFKDMSTDERRQMLDISTDVAHSMIQDRDPAPESSEEP